MQHESNTVLESLYKSIQTFDTLTIEREHRDKLWKYNDALMQSLHSIIEDQDSDNATKMQYLETTMAQYTAAMKELFPKLLVPRAVNPLDEPVRAIGKADPDRFDEIEEIEKFNPYHDSKGRFATANSHTSFTYAPGKSKAHDLAIAREKERAAAAGGGSETKPAKEPAKEPKEESNNTQEAFGKSTLPESVQKTCKDVEAKTVSRKTEKLTLVDEDGNIILEKSGGKGSVSFGAKEGFHMNERTTATHNHPGEFGGTFSGADIEVFVDYRLKGIRAVGREGTYSLERTSKTNGGDSYDFKQAFKKQSNTTNDKMRTEYNSQKKKVARGETTAEEANKQLTEYRTSLCTKQHDWLVQNAEKYGFNYVFEPAGKVGKMDDSIIKAKDNENEDVETTGEVVLDGEFINGDDWMIK